ncbi:hypothetical protein BD779DRAFT_1577423 [Infundibulicybe gibba]|nr:hypothetical protein BD779DRAFT_1577423 [Infundibulicybe gibba]
MRARRWHGLFGQSRRHEAMWMRLRSVGLLLRLLILFPISDSQTREPPKNRHTTGRDETSTKRADLAPMSAYADVRGGGLVGVRLACADVAAHWSTGERE